MMERSRWSRTKWLTNVGAYMKKMVPTLEGTTPTAEFKVMAMKEKRAILPDGSMTRDTPEEASGEVEVDVA